MKTSTAFNNRSEEGPDYLAAVNDCGNPFLDDLSPPFLTKNASQLSDDSDCLSDSSRKIRKKRNAYQKIPDDIRMKLLDAVKDGETLKSAAKRYKINYSSAKSILHTYRKEGRILKKSAQERTTTKKKGGCDVDEDPQPPKITKKHSAQSSKTIQSRSSITDRTKCETMSNQCSEDENSLGSLGGLNDNFMNLLRMDSHNPQQEGESSIRSQSLPPSSGQESRKSSFKEPSSRTTIDGDSHNSTKGDQKDDAAKHKIRIFGDLCDNSADSSLHQMKVPEMPNYMTFFNEFDSVGDMPAWNIRKFSLSEDFCQDPTAFLNSRALSSLEDKLHKYEVGKEGEDQKADPNCPLRSFMDTQNLFRQALRKASIASYSGSAGFRKNSIDWFLQ